MKCESVNVCVHCAMYACMSVSVLGLREFFVQIRNLHTTKEEEKTLHRLRLMC